MECEKARENLSSIKTLSWRAWPSPMFYIVLWISIAHVHELASRRTFSESDSSPSSSRSGSTPKLLSLVAVDFHLRIVMKCYEMLWNAMKCYEMLWNWTKPGWWAKKRPQFLDFCGNSHPSPGRRTFGRSSFGRGLWTFRKRNATVRGSLCRSPVELLIRCTVRCRFTLALTWWRMRSSAQAKQMEYMNALIELLSGKFKRTLW